MKGGGAGTLAGLGTYGGAIPDKLSCYKLGEDILLDVGRTEMDEEITKNIKYIFLSHSHIDHIAGLGVHDWPKLEKIFTDMTDDEIKNLFGNKFLKEEQEIEIVTVSGINGELENALKGYDVFAYDITHSGYKSTTENDCCAKAYIFHPTDSTESTIVYFGDFSLFKIGYTPGCVFQVVDDDEQKKHKIKDCESIDDNPNPMGFDIPGWGGGEVINTKAATQVDTIIDKVCSLYADSHRITQDNNNVKLTSGKPMNSRGNIEIYAECAFPDGPDNKTFGHLNIKMYKYLIERFKKEYERKKLDINKLHFFITHTKPKLDFDKLHKLTEETALDNDFFTFPNKDEFGELSRHLDNKTTYTDYIPETTIPEWKVNDKYFPTVKYTNKSLEVTYEWPTGKEETQAKPMNDERLITLMAQTAPFMDLYFPPKDAPRYSPGADLENGIHFKLINCPFNKEEEVGPLFNDKIWPAILGPSTKPPGAITYDFE